MNQWVRMWLADESGQDLIEYMLLTSFIGVASWVGVLALEAAIRVTYQTWDTASQSVWEPPPPTVAGS